MGDTSDFIPAALGQLSNAGHLYCAPLFADEELFWWNAADWTAARARPDQNPRYMGQTVRVRSKTYIRQARGERCTVELDRRSLLAVLLQFDRGKDVQLRQVGVAVQQRQCAARVGGDRTRVQDQVVWADGKQCRVRPGHCEPVQPEPWVIYEINIVEYYAQIGQAAFKSTITDKEVAWSVMPGIKPGTSGSVIVSEGFGLNKFGKNQAAALSFIKFVTGTAFQKLVALGKAGDVLPPSRKWVNSAPDVQKGFPFGTVLNEQSRHQLAWPGDAPYDWNTPFVQALTNLSKGT